MRARTLGGLALLTTVIILGTRDARPDVGPPVLVRLESDDIAKVGVPYHARLIIEAGESVELGSVIAGGEGWPQTDLATASTKVRKGSRTEFPFEIIPEDVSQPLRFGMEIDGHGFAAGFDVSPEATRLENRRPNLTQTTSKTFFHEAGKELVKPGMVETAHEFTPPDTAFLDAQSREPTAAEAKVSSRNIRVRGQFTYWRQDGTDLPLDGAQITVYDRDATWDQELASEILSSTGRFDVNFTWDPCGTCEAQPDIYVEVRLENDEVKERHQTIAGKVWTWETGTWTDYTGTDLDIGTRQASNAKDRRAMNVFTTTIRAWRWLYERGYDPPQVKIVYPATGSRSYYGKLNDTMHIEEPSGWNESTIVHEYGHHFEHSFSTLPNPSYCNGLCDDPQWWEVIEIQCGHCFWCEENGADALNEGFGDWLGVELPIEFAGIYNEPEAYDYQLESRQRCSADNTWDDPYITESPFAGFLLDMTDAAQDDDPNWPLGYDAMNIDGQAMLDVIAIDEPGTVQEFLDAFLNRYSYYVGDPLMWATAANNGYDFDTQSPTDVQNVVSTTHSVNVESPDATIEFSWDPSSDDWSGVAGYLFSVSLNFPISAPTTGEPDNRIAWESPSLNPGTYYFSIRAVDSAGRQSGSTSIGPFLVRAPIPANLMLTNMGGWGARVVPRPTDDALPGFAPSASTLPGDVNTTYWNAHVWNDGDESTQTTHAAWLMLDGVFQFNPLLQLDGFATLGPTAGRTEEFVLNRGPIPVTAGRHTFGVRTDALGQVAETSEADNEWSRQWVWEPATVLPNTDYTRGAPPRRNGGWDWLGSDPVYPNADGMRFVPTGRWNAFYVAPTDEDADYDVTLHEPSSGVSSGFESSFALSGRGPGCIDAVVLNGHQNLLFSEWDVGVTRITETSYADYEARHVESSTVNFGTPTQATLPANRYLTLWEFDVGSGETGLVTIDVDLMFADDTRGPLHVGYYDKGFATGSLLDATRVAVTDEAQQAIITLQIPNPGTYALAIWRDPKDDMLALDYRIWIHPTRPDFAPWELQDWPVSVVPRADNVFAEDEDPTPSLLLGDALYTYIGSAVANLQPVPSTQEVHHWVRVDGETVYDKNYAFGIGGVEEDIFVTPVLDVPGGRHVVSMHLDGPGTEPENDESNNKTGRQWIWRPKSMNFFQAKLRSAPPDPRGDWYTVPFGEFLYFNRDGARTPVFAPQPSEGPNGYWGGVALIPSDSCDVDLTLYELSTGPQDGFDDPVATSSWGTGELDFVMVNFNQDPLNFRALDAGYYKAQGEDDFWTEVSYSSFMGYYPLLETGPFGMPGNGRMLNMHEVWLDPGDYQVQLQNLDGTVDYGISAYAGPEDMWFGKSDYIEGAISWFSGPGADESFNLHAETSGMYLIAVWKRGLSELFKNGVYNLFVEGGVVDAPEVPLVTTTTLRDASPNPFNPRTTIHFDLAQAGPVDLSIYDLRGALVRQLADGRHYEPGNHGIVWDGTDRSGRTVASGTYFVLMEAGGVRYQKKVTLIK